MRASFVVFKHKGMVPAWSSLTCPALVAEQNHSASHTLTVNDKGCLVSRLCELCGSEYRGLSLAVPDMLSSLFVAALGCINTCLQSLCMASYNHNERALLLRQLAGRHLTCTSAAGTPQACRLRLHALGDQVGARSHLADLRQPWIVECEYCVCEHSVIQVSGAGVQVKRLPVSDPGTQARRCVLIIGIAQKLHTRVMEHSAATTKHLRIPGTEQPKARGIRSARAQRRPPKQHAPVVDKVKG